MGCLLVESRLVLVERGVDVARTGHSSIEEACEHEPSVGGHIRVRVGLGLDLCSLLSCRDGNLEASGKRANVAERGAQLTRGGCAGALRGCRSCRKE